MDAKKVKVTVFRSSKEPKIKVKPKLVDEFYQLFIFDEMNNVWLEKCSSSNKSDMDQEIRELECDSNHWVILHYSFPMPS